MAAFSLAKKMGANGLELDLRETSDGHLVVVHDSSLKRTTGVRRLVHSLSLERIRRLDAGAWFHSKFRGEGVPTLDEVLTKIKGMVFNLEIKEANPNKVLDTVERFGVHRHVFFSSFDHNVLWGIRNLDHGLRLGYLVKQQPWEEILRQAIPLCPFSLNLPLARVDRDIIQKGHNAGFKIFVYTVNHRDAMRRLIQWGVDGIFTNFPDRLKTQLKHLR